MAPLNVRVKFEKGKGEELVPLYDTSVGAFGKVYPVTFVDVLNLIRSRCGFEQKRLEHKPQ
jgi:hypothetical protein